MISWGVYQSSNFAGRRGTGGVRECNPGHLVA